MIGMTTMDEQGSPDASVGVAYGRFAKVIEQLKRPLSEAEIADGWSTGAKLGFASALIEIARADMPRTHPNRIHLARAMDHWGTSGGALADEILAANAQP